MGQTCQTCVDHSNFDYIPQGNMFQQNVQKLVSLLKHEILQNQPNQSLTFVQINANTTYLGQLNAQNKKQGYGELRSKGKFYVGNFVNNVPHGKGILKENQYFYFGNFYEGRPHGLGQEKNNQLEFYGQFAHGQKVRGKLVHSEYVYEGQFQNNLFEGKGKINYFIKGITYQGQFKHGKFHGQGLITFKDRYKYEGQFEDGNYHGKGLMLSDCGQIFEGSFQNGTKHGKGWVKTTDGHEIYAQWRQSCRHGKGAIKTKDDYVEVEWNQDKLIHH